MKKFLLNLGAAALLFILASVAHAEIIAKATNKSGGAIYLTNDQGACAKSMSMFTRTTSGVTMFGCWFPVEDLIMVTYSDGTKYTYDMADFELTKKKTKDTPPAL